MKPNGLRITTLGGALGMRVVRPSAIEDKVWDAVEAAIEAGWEPKRFKLEVAEAWGQYLRGRADDEEKELRR